ncbi:ferredoxin reductase-like protein [Moesziomyces antarcticus]|uniref:Related to CYC2 - cytochrome-c mitochondrial import factor n=1 Tax=Pseudozyma antarctica TaxID=84753 RepID=A0A5C3FFL2_PSEA2|nr:ferredoxin reductase-like protein [Moesziomyces antarcticus]GAK61965.1 ferredoxin reductase-like protein [Moesziomyces antarcticus]SPO42485.1 related to CYC2 - cytochrome-c mitochondrial import factor [Moesziomyces antarcticus]
MQNLFASARLTIRGVRSARASTHAPHNLAPRLPHAGRPRRFASSSSGSSSSSSSPPPKHVGPSIPHILLASAVIIAVMPKLLERYAKLSGTSPGSSRTSNSIPGKLEPHTHHPLALAASSFYPDAKTTSNHKLLKIALPASVLANSRGGEDDLAQRLRIRSVYIKEPSLVIERAYTPVYDSLPGTASLAMQGATRAEKDSLDLLVKRYPDGELGRFLHRAVPDASIPQLEVRGPVDTWSFERDSAPQLPDRIVMLVGGTGVTPAYQLLTNLFGHPNRPASPYAASPRVEVLYAMPDLDNALLVPQLHALASRNPDKVGVSLFAERLPSTNSTTAALGQLQTQAAKRRSWLPFFGSGSSLDAKLLLGADGASTTIPVFESRITQDHLRRTLAPTPASRTLVLVCGPDGMVTALAGPKSRDGQSQGALSGTLAHLGLKQQDVFKL